MERSATDFIIKESYLHTTVLKTCCTPLLLLMLMGVGVLAACGPKRAGTDAGARRYPLTGKVVSIDKENTAIVVDGDEVKGFMPAMAMAYKMKNAGDLQSLAAGDRISADIVVQNNDYWLEKIKVTQKANGSSTKPPTELHFPSPGDQVPDFHFVNQNNRQISVNQYRGKTLILTFIYTRCPFPDFCPRVSQQFAEVNRQLRRDKELVGKTHLLSISFDPAHDTPRKLREYGFEVSGTRDAAVFNRWQFVVPTAPDLPAIARFFGLTYSEQGGLITHSLSTAVIGPDGKISKWYHGSEWQAADLMKDAAAALHPPS